MNLGEKALRQWFRKSGQKYDATCECFHLGERHLVVLFSKPWQDLTAHGMMTASLIKTPRGHSQFKLRLNGGLYSICFKDFSLSRERATAQYMRWVARA